MFAGEVAYKKFESGLTVQDAVILKDVKRPRIIGPKYYFIHLRYFFDDCVSDCNPLGIWNCGGATIAYRRYPNRIVYSFAICSRNDNFSRKIGRTIAIGRIENGKSGEIPFTSEGNVSEVVENHIKPALYRRANHEGSYQRDFSEEISRADNPYPSQFSQVLY